MGDDLKIQQLEEKINILQKELHRKEEYIRALKKALELQIELTADALERAAEAEQDSGKEIDKSKLN